MDKFKKAKLVWLKIYNQFKNKKTAPSWRVKLNAYHKEMINAKRDD